MSNEHELLRISNNLEFQKLLSSNFHPLSHELQEWSKASYDKNLNYAEQLVVPTISGQYVRSKSESMIDYILCKYQIPFRYECALLLGNKKIYPDFTILHPQTGKTYYWEHFGMMDEIRYVESYNAKMKLYTTNGIIPSIQLIITYETKEKPLSFEIVEMLAKQYFVEVGK